MHARARGASINATMTTDAPRKGTVSRRLAAGSHALARVARASPGARLDLVDAGLLHVRTTEPLDGAAAGGRPAARWVSTTDRWLSAPSRPRCRRAAA